MKVTVKLGHSLFRHPLSVATIRNMGTAIAKLCKEGHPFVVVVGGGSLSRDYIDAGRHLGLDWCASDMVGIHASRLNARLMLPALGELAVPALVSDLEQVRLYLHLGRIVVTGGLSPGQSTDAVAALAAEVTGADLLVKMMDVGGIYTEDPKKHPNSRPLRQVSYERLREIVLSSYSQEAGAYSPVDLVALEVMGRSRIPTLFVGPDPSDLVDAVGGKRIGTRLIYE